MQPAQGMEALAGVAKLAAEEGVDLLVTRHFTRGYCARLYRRSARRGGGYMLLVSPDVSPHVAALAALRLLAMVSARGWAAYACARRGRG